MTKRLRYIAKLLERFGFADTFTTNAGFFTDRNPTQEHYHQNYQENMRRKSRCHGLPFLFPEEVLSISAGGKPAMHSLARECSLGGCG
jgi:hypothetical protein